MGSPKLAATRDKNPQLSLASLFQFCLEDENNFLDAHDWIVHLDEETLLTENCVKGILNFISNNKGCRYESAIYKSEQTFIFCADKDYLKYLSSQSKFYLN